jgi:CheY-like chemotaxis protein
MAKHILCADDSVTMQRVVAITFAQTEYQVHAARSADDAVALARQQPMDLVLADAVMPGKTGYDLCLALKSDAATKSVPVVLLCGNSQAYDDARGKQVGADGHLIKPWDTQQMADKVGELLTRLKSNGVAVPAGGVKAASAPAPASPPAPAPAATSARPSPMAAGSAPMAAASAPHAVAPQAAPSQPGLPKPPPGMPRPPLIKAVQPGVTTAPRAQTPLPSQQGAPPRAQTPTPTPGPPRSATIMGMPAVAMPPAGGMAPVVPVRPPAAGVTPITPARSPMPQATPLSTPVPAPAAAPTPAPAAAPSPAPIAPPATPLRPMAPAPAPTAQASPPPVATAAPAVAAVAASTVPAVAAVAASTVPAVAAVAASAAPAVAKAAAQAVGADPRGPEYDAILKLSREIIEKIAWEVVPELAEAIIKQHVDRLAARS